MTRTTALLLFALVAAAGAWATWRPTVEAPVAELASESCSGVASSTCDVETGDSPEDASPQSRHRDRTSPEPGASDTPPPPAGAAAEGDRWREEAERLFADGRVHDGVAAMRRAAEVDPTARNHGDLGALLEKLTLFDEAARHLKQAAELDPSNADRWLALANAYYRAIEPGEAWKAERRAREAEPGLVISRDDRGLLVRRSDGAHDTATPNP